MRRFDPQIQTRKSRSAADILGRGAPGADDSILPLSKAGKLSQEKAANKS
jgi:hypothetical protein